MSHGSKWSTHKSENNEIIIEVERPLDQSRSPESKAQEDDTQAGEDDHPDQEVDTSMSGRHVAGSQTREDTITMAWEKKVSLCFRTRSLQDEPGRVRLQVLLRPRSDATRPHPRL